MLAKTLVDRHYHDLRALAMALSEALRRQVADVDADVIQIDEANRTGHPEAIRRVGDAEWAHEPINHVLSAARGEKAVHPLRAVWLCFGNYGGQTIQQGLWRSLLPFLNALDVDHLVLEFARRGYDELAIRWVHPDCGLWML